MQTQRLLHFDLSSHDERHRLSLKKNVRAHYCTLQAKFGVTVTQDTCLHKVLKLRSVSFFDFDSDASCKFI